MTQKDTKLVKMTNSCREDLLSRISSAYHLYYGNKADVINIIRQTFDKGLRLYYDDKPEGVFTRKIDTFNDTLVNKIIYDEDHDFNATIVYHVDFQEPKKNTCKPVKEFVVLQFDGDTIDNYNTKYYKRHQSNLLRFIILFSNAFISTLREPRNDNLEYTLKWLEHNGVDQLQQDGQAYTIISQSPEYTSALLITRNHAVVYTLPTNMLSHSDTHIDQILCLGSLQEQLSNNPEIPAVNIAGMTASNPFAISSMALFSNTAHSQAQNM